MSMVDYNTFMGGVDRGDQVRGYYSCRTKCRKFYKYTFHFLLDVAFCWMWQLPMPLFFKKDTVRMHLSVQ